MVRRSRALIALGALLLGLRVEARAADSRVALTLDGRPMSRRNDVAIVRNGRLFVNAVDWTRAFNGLLIFEKNAIRLTVRGHTASYHLGSRTAVVDQKPLSLRAAPFERNGDIYIPVDTAVAIDGGLQLRWLGRRHADLRVGVFPS